MIVADLPTEQQALDWVRRIAEPGFSDWQAHLLWLEQDASHAEAFDRACLVMEAATAGLAPAQSIPVSSSALSANDNSTASSRPSHRSWWFAAGGGAVAASLAGLLMMSSPDQHGAMQAIETAPGAIRTIAMADGSRVTLNGGSRIEIVQGGAARGVTIINGEAFFDVVHDDRKPFTVRAGDVLARDVGTAFDVALDSGATRIAVRQGEVALGDDGTVRLKAGQAARIDHSGGVVRSDIGDPASAGSWQQGRLVYRDAPLSDVAADLCRSLGAPVVLDPQIAARRFTGIIVIDANHDLTMRRLAAAAGLAAGRKGNGWRLALR